MADEVEHRAIAVGIVGPGLVGKALLAQFAEQVRGTRSILKSRVKCGGLALRGTALGCQAKPSRGAGRSALGRVGTGNTASWHYRLKVDAAVL